jgi:hypothetical protein
MAEKFNAADFGVFAVFQLFAVPMCHAGWDAIVSGEHPGRGIMAIILGLPIGLAGASFHWWKNKLPSARDWTARQADRWWPVALLVAFVYVAGPSLYQRTYPSTGPSSPMGRIVWDFDQNASGRGYFLNISKTSDQESRILGFQAHGKNNSSDPITEFSGFIRSVLTNAPRPIYILAQDADESKIPACSLRVPTLSEDTFGIPPFADFDVTTFEKAFTNFAVDGTPVSKFMSDFGPFSVVLNYDGAKYERPFSRAEILNQVAILEKTAVIQSVPRVIRKSTAPKVTFPPLRVPSPQATPVPPKASDNPLTGTISPRN